MSPACAAALVGKSVSWLLAFAWAYKAATTLYHFPRLPDLNAKEYGHAISGDEPLVCVIVPARNEEEDVEATLRSLLGSTSLPAEIIAVDDRSADANGSIMDRVAAEASQRTGDDADRNPVTISVLHIRDLPAEWLGKTHAMAAAAQRTQARWLLFTDGDVTFEREALYRALNYAEREQADHVVLMPTLTLITPGESIMIGAIQALTSWGWSPWRVANPKTRDFIGIGAFNLIRRDAYLRVGGYEAARMEILEDLRMGWMIKRAGLKQRFVRGKGLVRIRWGKGAIGVIRNLKKNAFALFRFQLWLIVPFCLVLAVCAALPIVDLFWGPWLAAAGVVSLLSMWLLWRTVRESSAAPIWYALAFPFAMLVLAGAYLHSAIDGLIRRGVVWRGTLYPLEELRRQARSWW